MPAVIGGRYRVLRAIGRGGMGAVYEAEDLNTGERVALKTMLSTSHDNDPQLAERFRREARASSIIDSEHVVQTTEVAEAPELGGRLYFTMELLRGQDLAQITEERGRIPANEVLAWLEAAASALDRAHARGIIHRDLKPENLFVHETLSADGSRKRILKVLDFGVAKLTSGEVTNVTKTGAVVGTPHYMAPEQVSADRNGIGPWTDIWALGMIAFELVTGQPHYALGSSAYELLKQIAAGMLHTPSARAAVPEGFDDWFRRSCAFRREARFASVSAQVDALRSILEVAADTQRAPRTVTAPPPPIESIRAIETPAPVPLPIESIPAIETPTPPPMRVERPVVAARRRASPLRNALLFLAAGALLVLITATLHGRSHTREAAASTLPPHEQKPALSAMPEPEPEASSVPIPEAKPLPPATPPPPKPHPPPRVGIGDKGQVTINSHPWAEVRIDGRVMCHATPCTMQMPPGTYILMLHNPEVGVSRTSRIEVPAGGKTVRNFALH
jgi:serine/threonine protein kinase